MRNNDLDNDEDCCIEDVNDEDPNVDDADRMKKMLTTTQKITISNDLYDESEATMIIYWYFITKSTMLLIDTYRISLLLGQSKSYLANNCKRNQRRTLET